MFSLLNFIAPIIPSFFRADTVVLTPQPTLIRIQVNRSPAFAPTQVDTTLAVALPTSGSDAPQVSLGLNLTVSEYQFWMRMGPSAISTSESRRSNCSTKSSMTSRSSSVASYSSSSSTSSSRQSSRQSLRASSRATSTKSLSPPASPKKSGFFSSQPKPAPSNIRTSSGGLPTSGNCILTEEEFDEDAFFSW